MYIQIFQTSKTILLVCPIWLTLFFDKVIALAMLVFTVFVPLSCELSALTTRPGAVNQGPAGHF
jgi:hypothetical protein